MKNPEVTDFDKKLWQRELEEFVPAKIYDVHTHLWNEKFADGNRDVDSVLRLEIDLPALRSWSGSIFPGRSFGFLALPTPLADIDVSGHNQWMVQNVQGYVRPVGDFPSFSGILVTPDMSPEELRGSAGGDIIAALKPYRIYAPNPAQAKITDFFPENLMEAADSLGLAVVLHLSKFEGPADRENLDDLTKFTRRYPHIKWILAHCARAFNSVFLQESIHILRELPSLWIDTSAVNDSYSHYLLFRYFDRKRILFGTDNVSAGSFRGKYITYGYAWEGYGGKDTLEHCDSRSTFVVYEQLRSQKQAADMVGLKSSEIDDLFFGNALSLLDIERFSS